ncbi:MAG: hypothetical protein ACXWNK_02570 [Vulcanimicrobiaceae bacterium]
MKAKLTLPFSLLAVLLAGLLAACGGGGSGGGSVVPPAGNPNPGPQASPTGAAGTMSLGGQGMANAKVVFTCGCSLQAGSTTADGSGNYSLPSTSSAVPATPNPTYTTQPGRNYIVIGAAGHTESWTMLFLGSTTAHNLYLSASSANVSDEFTTAASLYVFYNSQNMSDQSFDTWNLNTIAAWTQSLRASGGNNAAEQKLIADVKSAQQAGNTLFPTVPAWDPNAPSSNGTIRTDIQAVKSSGDPALPTPCPASGCTGAPSP